MGDILLATPVIDVLKEKYPDCQIDWIVQTKFKNVLENHPHIEHLYHFSSKSELSEIRDDIQNNDYDFVFDLHRNMKTNYITKKFSNVFKYNKRVFDRTLLVWFKKHYKKIIPITKMYFAALNEAGIVTPEKWDLRFDILSEVENKIVNQYNLKKGKYLVFVPGASYFSKMWPMKRYREVLSALLSELDEEYRFLILGYGKREEEIASYLSEENRERCLNLVGKLSLAESAAVIKHSSLLLSNDSGLLHMAECYKTKVVGIFGSTTEELGFFPYSTDYTIVEQKNLSCRPCSHFGRKKCPQKHFRCMTEISAESVKNVVLAMLVN